MTYLYSNNCSRLGKCYHFPTLSGILVKVNLSKLVDHHTYGSEGCIGCSLCTCSISCWSFSDCFHQQSEGFKQFNTDYMKCHTHAKVCTRGLLVCVLYNGDITPCFHTHNLTLYVPILSLALYKPCL